MYVIDGLFLTENITGIQRTSRELIRELGKLAGETRLPAQESGHRLELMILVPGNYEGPETYENIPVVPYGKYKGRLWEQLDLPRYLREHNCPGLFTENTIPLMLSQRRGERTGKNRNVRNPEIPGIPEIREDWENIVILHDVCLRAMPLYFLNSPRGIISYLWRRLQYRRIAQLAQQTQQGLRVVTVSEFSKSEILRFYPIDPDQITVIYNAWQHMRSTGEPCSDHQSDQQADHHPGAYVFSVSSGFPHKNFRWIAQTAGLNQDVFFVVAGISDEAARKLAGDVPENLILTGYITDEEMRRRMKECAAFLFPSLYEGFGMPPLEAAACGAPRLIVSDTPCMREIYGDAAQYIDPMRAEMDFARLLETPASDHSALLARYSWEKSAVKLAGLMGVHSGKEAGRADE